MAGEVKPLATAAPESGARCDRKCRKQQYFRQFEVVERRVVSNGRELYNPPPGMSNLGSFILAIDTASRSGSIAAARDGRLVAVWGVDTGARQSSVLWEDIEIMLSRLEASIDDVSAIAVARGPGAFTGLRIGLAAAAGMARASGAALFGVTTLELTARSSGAGENVWAVLNAYRNEVYAQRMRVDSSGEVTALAEPVVGPPADVFESVGGVPARIVGDGAVVYRAHLDAVASSCGVAISSSALAEAPAAATWNVVPAGLCLAADLAELMLLRIARGAIPGPVAPCYLRDSEAEVNRKAGRIIGAGAPRGV